MAGRTGGKGGKRSAGPGRSGARPMAQRVRTAKGRPAASTRWIERQLNDPYVHKAKAAGYRSRAAYKLIEIDDKHRLLRPGQRVVDLGAAPGSWAQVALERTRASAAAPVVAIDRLPMDPLDGVTALQLDFLNDEAPAALTAALGGAPVDVVLSDLAPDTTGHRATDHLRIVALVEAAHAFAAEVLAPGGAFLAKVFQGGTEGALLAALRRDFRTVRHLKPPASRAGSPETYVLATGFRGDTGRPDTSAPASGDSLA